MPRLGLPRHSSGAAVPLSSSDSPSTHRDLIGCASTANIATASRRAKRSAGRSVAASTGKQCVGVNPPALFFTQIAQIDVNGNVSGTTAKGVIPNFNINRIRRSTTNQRVGKRTVSAWGSPIFPSHFLGRIGPLGPSLPMVIPMPVTSVEPARVCGESRVIQFAL